MLSAQNRNHHITHGKLDIPTPLITIARGQAALIARDLEKMALNTNILIQAPPSANISVVRGRMGDHREPAYVHRRNKG